MSKVVNAVIGVAMIVVGAITGNVWLIASGVTTLGSALLAPKMKSQHQERQASVTSLKLGEGPREAIFGTCVTGGGLVDAFNFGGKYGTDWEVVIFDLADHECHSLLGFYVNDQYVTFAGDGTVAGYNGQLQVYWRSGTETQTLPSIVTSNGPGWTANDNGAGVAYVVVAYKADASDAKNPVWTAGRPRFKWHVKGAKCYIARKDSTVPGGSGSHRRDNPATWEWTDNPIDCRYNWVRGMYACNRVTDQSMVLVGRGLSAIEAPPVNTFAPANLCDEAVALEGGGTEKRYLAAAVIRADDPFISVEELWASSCGGVITQHEGCVEIEPGQAKSVVASFTDDDLVVGSKVEASDFLSEADDEWINTVVPRYVEPTQKWADHAAPIRRNIDDIVADGGPREDTLSLPWVTRASQAGRVGEIRRKLGRLWKRRTVTLGPRFAEIEEGDWVAWTSARYLKGETVKFRVEAYGLDRKWQNTLKLREITINAFSPGPEILDEAVADDPNAPPPIGAPAPGAWTLTGGTNTANGVSQPIITITGATDDVHATAVLFEYRVDDGEDPETADDWIGTTIAAPTVKRRQISSVASGEEYYAAVTYMVNRVPGERRILGPVTAGALSVDFDNVTGDSKEELLNSISDALLGNSKIWTQPTAPTFAQSKPGDYWRDSANGFRQYVRVDGYLTANGNRILANGNLLTATWSAVDDARIAAAVQAAAAAQAAADAAGVKADEALDALDNLADDGVLSINEKITTLIPKDAQLDAAWALLDEQADDFAITTERAAAAAARAAWISYRNGLSPAWNATTGNTPVLRSTFVGTLTSYNAALDALQKAISDKAALTATWDSVTGPGRPEDGATRNVSRGAWNAGISDYVAGDVVTFIGASYVALQSVPVNTPPPDAPYWTVFSEGGAKPDIKFIRSAAQPSTPTGSDPAGWSDGIPAGIGRLWMSRANKKYDGTMIGSWSIPESISDINARGIYAAGTTYYPLDWVTYLGGSYIAIGQTTGHAPSGTAQANSYWDVLAAPGDPGEPAIPPSAFTATIDLGSSSGVNLRTAADAAGYTGASDATITFEVESGVVIRGTPGSLGIDTGTWPSGYTIALTLVVKSGAIVDGGGGWGGSVDGVSGAAGGNAIFLRHNMTGGITINAGGTVRGGGGGGGAGGQEGFNHVPGEPDHRSGSGGGGGAPNGSGGSGAISEGGNNGAAGTTSGGGAGGTGNANGGDGGTFATAGGAGQHGGSAPGAPGSSGGSGGAAGYAVRKNGFTATVTNNGTMLGTAA